MERQVFFLTISTHYTHITFNFKKIKSKYDCKMKSVFFFFLLFLAPLLCDAQGEYTVFKYDDGIISSEGYMRDGKPDGYWKTYYPDGTIKSRGLRTDFELDSLWQFYNERGQLSSEITYDAGKKHGPYRAFRNGVLYEEATFENDRKVGEALFYYPTGELQKRIPFVDGKEEGEGFEYAPDGRIISLFRYKEGNLLRSERVNRFDKEGKKRGPWVTFHSNGMLASEGSYMNNQKHGVFKYFDRKGDLITLEKFREGDLVLDSEEAVILDIRSTYYSDGSVKSTGGYVDGMKEGTHRSYDRDGNIISGKIYRKGEVASEGLIDETGDYQGYWKLYYDTGELQAEGEFENSRRIGDWVYYHKNGEVEHKAKFVDGLPQGKWTWYFDNGKLRREEYYRRGKEDGKVIEYDREGKIVVEGDYVSGLRDGDWFLNVGDHTERGAYSDGERVGDWVYEYMDGTPSFKGSYQGGLATGKHIWYHPNGRVKLDGRYSSGVRVGTWKKYNEEGIEVLNVKYKSGREVRINGRRVVRATEEVLDPEL